MNSLVSAHIKHSCLNIMVYTEKEAFCKGESPQHCGNMQIKTCTSLAVKVIESYGNATPPSIFNEYHAYKEKKSHENSLALCQAVWTHTNSNLKEFIQAYQQYTSKKDIPALLDRLIKSEDRESTDDTCDCEDPEKGREVPVLVIHGVVRG